MAISLLISEEDFAKECEGKALVCTVVVKLKDGVMFKQGFTQEEIDSDSFRLRLKDVALILGNALLSRELRDINFTDAEIDELMRNTSVDRDFGAPDYIQALQIARAIGWKRSNQANTNGR